MKGYPKHVATKQDFLNLLSQEEFKEQALEDLRKIYEAQDDTVIRVVSGSEEEGNLVTEEIENPMPLWKVKGFSSRQEVADLITRYGGKA
ncbi:MAG: hypothetical protein DRI01_09990 [Chloroflexi bacterium]|nr:MAG: hypothetical protein DRI01_09990 [Chloroflexota bacterium]